MQDLFTILTKLEKDENVHLGRLAILINRFSESKNGEIQGLTKLAKLDFLLRYPAYLERALQAQGKEMKKAPPQPYEKKSVEAKMIRFKYGPWDFRYRKFINILVGLRLVYLRSEGRSYNIGITPKGAELCQILESKIEFEALTERSKTIKSHFDYTGTTLMRFIYETFPEIGTLDYGKEIK